MTANMQVRQTDTLFNKISNTLAFSLILLAPFINYLHYNDYGYTRAESILIAFAIIGIGIIVAGCYSLCGWFGRTLIFALTVTFALNFFPAWQPLLVVLLTFILAILLAMLLADYAGEILLIFSVVLLFGIIFLPSQQQFSRFRIWSKPLASDPVLPPIVYIILDEHAGIEAIPTDINSGTELKEKLKLFYLKAGFQLFGNAYSHYPSTYNSIPNLLNFTSVPMDDYYFTNPGHRNLLQNQFFTLLTNKGYKIHIYQPDFINYCNSNNAKVSYCYTYPSLSMRMLAQSSLDTESKFIWLLRDYLLQSSIYQSVMYFYECQLRPILQIINLPAPDWTWYQARVSTLPTLTVMHDLKADILHNSSGTIYFAHIFLPHNPYVYDQDCNLNPVESWLIGHGPPPIINTATTREHRYSIYDAQVGCVTKQLQEIFSAMQTAGIYDKSIIIIHGDHGARIALHRPMVNDQGVLTQQDFHDYYITLFAAKVPGLKPGYDTQMTDLQGLLANVTTAIVGQPIHWTQTTPYIYLYPNNVGDQLRSKQVSELRSK